MQIPLCAPLLGDNGSVTFGNAAEIGVGAGADVYADQPNQHSRLMGRQAVEVISNITECTSLLRVGD